MKTVIVCAGSLDRGFLTDYFREHPQDYVIAADKGLDYLTEAGIAPDLILGDYDSVSSPDCAEKFREEGTEVLSFAAEKDFTDTEAAINEAIRRNSSEITLLGAAGGRLDHFLSNLNCLLLPLRAGIPAYIADRQNRIQLICTETHLKKKDTFGKYVSLLPFTDTVEGLQLSGFKYPLDGVLLTKDNSLGISNEISEDEAVISFAKGILILIFSKDESNHQEDGNEAGNCRTSECRKKHTV